MTFEEIKQIPDLQIEVTPLVEDCFFLLQALNGDISDKAGESIFEKIKGRYTKEEYKEALVAADKMVNNLKKYGVACAEWV